MAALSDMELLQRFSDLRQFQRGGHRAPHKPLLILLALGRLARGESRMVEFSDIEHQLRQLIEEFGPSVARGAPQYPFWHLRTDQHGGLWELSGPASILDRPAGSTPGLGELREQHVRGGFSPEVDEALRKSPELVEQLAQSLLSAHFPESLHADIRAAVGLPEVGRISVGEAPAAQQRDPTFRQRVLRAYEHRCAVCGLDLRIGSITAAIEAAHIKWFQASGPDIESNGLALCSLHHKVFDLGGFTVLPENYQLTFSQAIVASEPVKNILLGYHGASLILPQSRAYYPAQQFLAWHRSEVFKEPGRDLPGEL
jgi:putative restriction endonuclease